MTISVLFSGYAPVHFLCFRPLYERLRHDSRFEVRLSGGLKRESAEAKFHDTPGLYDRFGVDPAHVLDVPAIKERDFDVLFSAHTNLIRPRAVGATVQIFHGVSFRNRALRPANMNCDHYFVVGPYMRRRLHELGLLLEGDPRCVSTGFMKTDALVDGTLDRRDTLRRHGFDGTRPVVLYAPTGAAHNSLTTGLGEEVVRQLGACDRFDVLIKLHDHPKDDVDWRARLGAHEGPHLRISGEDDVTPLLHAADLLISDASSVSSEFSLCDRPMVFLDLPKLIEELAASDDKSADLASWGRSAGRLVTEAEEAVDAVTAEFADPDGFRPIRQAMANDLFFNPGRATDAAVDWLRRTFVRAA